MDITRNNNNQYIGIYRGVVEDNDDPENLGRCRIRVDGIHGYLCYSKSSLPWARAIVPTPVSPDTQRGSVNIPDVGDIVWVMFEGGNKYYPVYLGGTYSKKDLPVNKNLVNIFSEDGNSITYDRQQKTFLITSGPSIMKLSNSGVEVSGNVHWTGIDIGGADGGNGEGEGGGNASSDTTKFPEKSLQVTNGVGINRLSDSEAFCSSLITTITVLCRDENGNDYNKTLSVNKYLADNIRSIFKDIYEKTTFRIISGSTGAYNYRRISGSSKLSYHSYGVAIDLNWNLNPYSKYADGSDDDFRIRTMSHPVVQIFLAHDWGWGGTYHDYMHFSYFNGH